MPVIFILILGLAIFNGELKKNNSTQEKVIADVKNTKVLDVKPIIEQVKVEPKEPEPVKEQVKVEPKDPEQIKEVASITEPETSYIKLFLIIVGSILTILTGAYFFTKKRSDSSLRGKLDNEKKDIEEKIQPEPQEQQPVEEEVQPEPQEQQPTEEDENNKK